MPGTPVKIHIMSMAKDGKGYQPATELHYRGSLLEKDGKYYATYVENGEESFQGTHTTIKWDQERVLILRSGALQHRQEFAKGLVDESIYRTPYLEIPLETTTKYLYTYFRKGAWHIELDYALAQAGEPYGDMKLAITIEEVEECE